MWGRCRVQETMTKRQIIYNKFNGKCAYSGTPLKDDWQVDHLVPKAVFDCSMIIGNRNDLSNLMPVQKIINHYKRALPLHLFKSWYLGGLHERLKKLPRNPITERSKKRIAYMREIAELFDITEDKPFNGKLYFETNPPDAGNRN